MSEETTTTTNEETTTTTSVANYKHNKLKDVNVTAIEMAIAKALGELVGVEYKCSIDEIAFGNRLTKGGEFKVSLSEIGGNSFFDFFGRDFSHFPNRPSEGTKETAEYRLKLLSGNPRLVADVLLSEDRGFSSEEISSQIHLNKYLVESMLSEFYRHSLIRIDRSTGEAIYQVKSD